jgi:hypothetical protein
MALHRLLLILAAVLALSPISSAQTNKPSPTHKPPQLTLEIIPLKKSYFVGETVFVKYRLTSLVDGTLCFAPPALEQTGDAGGYLKTDVTAPNGVDVDIFIDGVWPVYPTDEEIRRDVTDRWIKLGMSEPYISRKRGRITVLSRAGRWVLKSTYYPPDFKGDQRAIVESLGCAAPDVEVHSDPVTITVLTSAK